MTTLRSVLAELQMEVKGLGDVQAATHSIDRYVAKVSPAVSQVEKLRVAQQEANELAGRLATRIRKLQRAEGDHAAQIAELRVAMTRAKTAAADYSKQVAKLTQTEEKASLATAGPSGSGGLLGSVKGLQTKMLAAGAAIAGVTTVFRAFTSVVDQADELDRLSKSTGIATDELQRLQFIANQTGAPFDKVRDGLKSIARVAEGGLGPFRQLGLSVKEANGQFKTQDKLMMESLSALGAMEDATKKAAFAQQLFGDSGVELLAIAEQSPEKLAELTTRFEELGGGLSTGAIKAATDAASAFGELDLAFTAIRGSVATAVLPAVNRLAKGAATISAAFQKAAAKSNVLEAAMLTLAAVAAVVAVATIGIWGPALLVAAAIAGIVLVVDDVITAFKGGESVFGSFVETIAEHFGVFLTFRGMIEALGIAWELVEQKALEAVAGIIRAVQQVQQATGLDVFGDLSKQAKGAEFLASQQRGRVAKAQQNLLTNETQRRTERLRVRKEQALAQTNNVDARANITVNGAGDPDGVARRVMSELNRQRRQAGQTIPVPG